MKHLIAFIVSVSILMSCFALSVHAANDANDTVSAEELNELQACIQNHGFSTKQLVASVLYNDDDIPTYIFASSEDGYAILDRGTLRFNECGEINPYRDYMDCPKYYGGPLCYYVKGCVISPKNNCAENEYFDLRKQEYSDIIQKVEHITRKDEEGVKKYPNKKGFSYFLPNNYSGIRRKAYGFNNDGTCSAVATGIALNYIAKEYNMAIVPSGYISPLMDNGAPNDEDALYAKYPEAKKLHRYLTDTCGMGWMSFGAAITTPITEYADTLVSERLGFEDDYCYNLHVSWTLLPSANTIKNNIIAGKPVLITTTVLAHDYNWHTMCVYGFRDTYGYDEILVHSGWYTDLENDNTSNNSKRQAILWLNEDIASFGYYFDYENPLAQFNDIPEYTNWAYRGILYVVHKNYMNGVTDTSFSPSGSMTRAMFATTLYRMAGSPSAAGLPNPYSDISSSSYYYDAVRWVTARGIANGTSPGVFSPDGLITREQLAVMLYRYANYCGFDTNAQADLTRFPDHASVSNYALTAMRWAVAEGYITGVQIGGVDYLVPQNYTTRAQVATIISRFCNY